MAASVFWAAALGGGGDGDERSGGKVLSADPNKWKSAKLPVPDAAAAAAAEAAAKERRRREGGGGEAKAAAAAAEAKAAKAAKAAAAAEAKGRLRRLAVLRRLHSRPGGVRDRLRRRVLRDRWRVLRRVRRRVSARGVSVSPRGRDFMTELRRVTQMHNFTRFERSETARRRRGGRDATRTWTRARAFSERCRTPSSRCLTRTWTTTSSRTPRGSPGTSATRRVAGALIPNVLVLAHVAPQILVVASVGVKYASDLPLCFFAQTLGFVAFNRRWRFSAAVSTAQYFVWYSAGVFFVCFCTPLAFRNGTATDARGAYHVGRQNRPLEDVLVPAPSRARDVAARAGVVAGSRVPPGVSRRRSLLRALGRARVSSRVPRTSQFRGAQWLGLVDVLMRRRVVGKQGKRIRLD